MTFDQPLLAVAAVLLTGAAVAAYVLFQRRRAAALAGTGLAVVVAATASRRAAAVRRHLPYALYLAALGLLLFGAARPQAMLDVPRAAGTVVLVFDVSNSMSADDIAPSRLAATQAAATRFVHEQPETVDIGVVAFGQNALETQPPTDDHDEAIAAIGRLKTSGGTSLGQAILSSLSTVVGRPVSLPEEAAAGGAAPDGAPGPGQDQDLGYWGSATIVLFSDGEDTSGPDAEAAAGLAATAGVHIETVGVGTPQGDTIEVDGFRVGTALDDQTLASIAEITGGTYRPAADAAALNDIHESIDLRVSTVREPLELTGPLAAGALLLLTVGALLMLRWHGRIV